jgi:L-arabinonolactonase
MTEVKRVVDADNHVGESPTWSPREQALWWINCDPDPAIFRWRPESGERRSWPMPRRIGALALGANGTMLVALSDGVYDFDPATAQLTLRARSPLPDHVKLHEGQCDRQGRFWIGAFDHRFPADRLADGGAWFRLDGDTLVPVIEGVAVANGLAFSPDGRTMYAASTPRRVVEAFDLDPETGTLSNGRTFVTLAPGGGHIDGATVDDQGGYWLAIVGKAAIRRYLPNGSFDREIALPFSNPTKPSFGGKTLATLFITSTKMRIGPEIQTEQENGGLFALSPGFTGVADTPFAG